MDVIATIGLEAGHYCGCFSETDPVDQACRPSCLGIFFVSYSAWRMHPTVLLSSRRRPTQLFCGWVPETFCGPDGSSVASFRSAKFCSRPGAFVGQEPQFRLATLTAQVPRSPCPASTLCPIAPAVPDPVPLLGRHLAISNGRRQRYNESQQAGPAQWPTIPARSDACRLASHLVRFLVSAFLSVGVGACGA